jgi:predicted HicB family RNase H-like nuclease
LQHRGYTGQVEFDDEARLFHGEVIDLRAVVTFQGTSIEEIEEAFRYSVATTWRSAGNAAKLP